MQTNEQANLQPPEEKFNQEHMKDYICTNLDAIISRSKDFHKVVDQWFNDWRDIKEEKITPWIGCANYSIPITSTFTDSVVARIIEGNIGVNPPVDAFALNASANNHKNALKMFMRWDLKTHPDLLRQLWFFADNTGWSGTGWIKSYFKKEKEIVEEVVDMYQDMEGNFMPGDDGKPLEVSDERTAFMTQAQIPFTIQKDVIKKTEQWKHYNPDQAVYDIKDVLIPDDCTSIEDAWENSIVACRIYRTKDFLRRQLKQDDKELYKNLDKVTIKGFEPDKRQDGDEEKRERKELETNAAKSKKIPFYEVYLNYDVDGDGLEEKIVAIVHLKSKTLLGWEKFPYKHGKCPIIPGYIKPIHNHVYGVGVPEMCFDTKSEIDAIHNMRTDRNAYFNNPVFMHTAASGFKPKIHKFGTGRNWRLSGIRRGTDIDYLMPPRTEGHSKEEESIVFSYGQKRVGVTDNFLGVQDASNQTASGIFQLRQEGNLTFRKMIKWMSLSIGEFFSQRMALYKQYWGEANDPEAEQWIQEIMDSQENPLKGEGREAIKQNFNIIMTATNEDRELEIARAQTAHDLLIMDPVMKMFPEKFGGFTADLLRKLGFENIDARYPSEQEIMQRQAMFNDASIKLKQELPGGGENVSEPIR